MNYYRLYFKHANPANEIPIHDFQDELSLWVNQFLMKKNYLYYKKTHPKLKSKIRIPPKPSMITEYHIMEFKSINTSRFCDDELCLEMVFGQKEILIANLEKIFKDQNIRLDVGNSYVYIKVDRVEHHEVRTHFSALAFMN
ncbi:MAG: hypothetical protein JEZ03_16225 [Bacteroidales bacterium]|nr:hypothetical protein [Bacteroidales bacterium]